LPPSSCILDFHEAGYSAAAILREYPQLREIDVEAAIAHERRMRDRRLSGRAGDAAADRSDAMQGAFSGHWDRP
jgi:hypothetical protein